MRQSGPDHFDKRETRSLSNSSVFLLFVFDLVGYFYHLFLEKAMATHSSTPACKVPWTEEPGGLQSMGSRRVGHDWTTSLSLSLSCIGEGNGNPLQCFCLENSRNGGVWWAAIYGVAQSRTRLKWLSSSSSRVNFIFLKIVDSVCSFFFCLCQIQ